MCKCGLLKNQKKNRDKKTTYTPFFPSFQNFDLYRLVQEIVRFFRRLHFKKTNKASCGVKYHSFVEIHVLWSNSKYTEITESLQGKLTFHWTVLFCSYFFDPLSDWLFTHLERFCVHDTRAQETGAVFLLP